MQAGRLNHCEPDSCEQLHIVQAAAEGFREQMCRIIASLWSGLWLRDTVGTDTGFSPQNLFCGTLLPSITTTSWLGLLPPPLGLSGNASYLEIVCSPLDAWGEWWEGALWEFSCCIAAFSGVSVFQNLSTGQKQWLKSSKWLFVGQTCCVHRSGLTYFPLGGSDL